MTDPAPQGIADPLDQARQTGGPMRRRCVLSAGMALAALLPGCASLKSVGEATGVLDAAGAVSLYGIAKGVAEVALIADPALTSIVNATLALAAPLLVAIQSAGPTATTSVAALIGQSNALLLATAGVITVTPNRIAA
ncbi:hypothetical protein [Lichenicola sp.]|uniref:hypothetical protein n=1 Tax=Lichenicola sp. TaxID=2804529 RepID=UPI003B005ECE